MGVITKIRNGIVSAAEAAGDGIAKASQLSPAQVRSIDDKREKYLSEKPSMDDDVAEELTNRNLGAISIEINNSYLPQMSTLYLPIQESDEFDSLNRISYFEIVKWVKDPDEDNIEKLMNVYQVLSEEECNIALIYNRTVTGCSISFAVVNNGDDSDANEVNSYVERITGAVRGNFPGVQFGEEGSGIPKCLDFCSETSDDNSKSVAIVSNLATEKTEKFSAQTIEKVLDGIVPKEQKEEYTIVLLATPVKEVDERKNRLYELYNALAPYSNWQTAFTYTQMEGVSSSATFGVNIGASAGTQSGISRADGTQNGTSITDGTSTTEGSSTSASSTTSASAGIGPVNVGESVSIQHGVSKSKSKSHSITETIAKVTTDGKNKGHNFGINAGVNFARSSSVTTTLGKNEGITQNFVNYGIKHSLELLEKQLKRLEESSALGLWDFAAYFVSGNSIVANNVAHTYLALTQGEESFLAESAVNLWRGDLAEEKDNNCERMQAKNILVSLSRLQHPEFCLKYGEVDAMTKDFLMYPTTVTATTSLSGKEIARALNFPSKSVCGVPIIETASFGRGVSSYNHIDSDLSLGQVYHMHSAEEGTDVKLSKKSLAAHTFVAGSTGSGKTNTVTSILKKLVFDEADKDTHFLVIEPAKGEYRNVFGGYDDVTVYGTNPKFTELLRLNPFSFPKNIAVGEHIDRLVEIFNVCWPMYAAMPAIMKDAIIKSYEEAGWDIDNSENVVDEEIFPSFIDVMNQVKYILNNSEYSSDTKGDYVGALVSRLRSLTNGINGQIFTARALSDQDLFEKNVIIDMSRVGSIETKSLIMGLLVLKLQEYRLSKGESNSGRLRHITVLEEAHNLLRRTSTEMSNESANLLGKSVEMLTNAIAELRSFGEGFIIVDQAPGLLDMAAIRNTNTKILHRLPDYSDRELVGKAIGLTDSQIVELARLEVGVAAIYQNEWTQAVLCQVEKFKEVDKKKNNENTKLNWTSEKDIKKELTDYLINIELKGEGKKGDLEKLCEKVKASQLSVSVKKDILLYKECKNDMRARVFRQLMYDLLDMKKAVMEADKESKIDDWVYKLIDKLNPPLRNYSAEQVEIVVGILLNEQYERDGTYRKIFQAFDEFHRRKGGIL